MVRCGSSRWGGRGRAEAPPGAIAPSTRGTPAWCGWRAPRAAGAVLALLTDAARMHDERAALEHASDLLGLFRYNRFRDVATAEQQLAGNIIDRMAIYRIRHHDVVA